MKETKDLSIKTVPVEIRVITVDGKRMTKAVVSQIPVVYNSSIVDFDTDKNCFVWQARYMGWCWYKEPHMAVEHKWCLFSWGSTLVKIKYSDIVDYGPGVAPFFYAGEYRERALFDRVTHHCLVKKYEGFGYMKHEQDDGTVIIDAISIDEFSGSEEQYKDLISDFNSRLKDLNEFIRLLGLASHSIKEHNDFVRSMVNLEHQIYISI